MGGLIFREFMVISGFLAPLYLTACYHYTAKNHRCQTVDEYFWRPFAVRCIGRRMFLCTICALEHLYTNRQPTIYAQTADKYFGRQFAVRLCTNVWRIFRTTVSCPFVEKRLTDILERKGKENSMKIKKIAFSENVSNYHKKKIQYIGQQTDSKRLSDVLVHKRLRGQIYIHLPFEHRASVYCPNFCCVLRLNPAAPGKSESC